MLVNVRLWLFVDTTISEHNKPLSLAGAGVPSAATTTTTTMRSCPMSSTMTSGGNFRNRMPELEQEDTSSFDSKSD